MTNHNELRNDEQDRRDSGVAVVRYWALGILSSFVITNSSFAADATSLAFFENDIRPLLIQRCVKCHGPKKAESGLRLDTLEFARKGGDTGPGVVSDRPDKSLIIQAVRRVGDLKMPPDEKLSDREIAALVRWIRDGAQWPDGMKLVVGSPMLRGGAITNEDRAFWSFQPITDPPVPQVDGKLRVDNDIDRFVHTKLVDTGLQLRTPTEKRVLIRRATFDLTGLPPTPNEIDAFLADDSPDAFAAVINRSLESRTYGERWGRHWLDVVRYADTAGETADYPTPLSWKYRNWVIDAFNMDKPYDEFISEQIAGDILADRMIAEHLASSSDAALDDATLARYREMLTATGFIAVSRRFGFDVENYHHLTIQDTIDTVGQAVLGLSLGCARCHDHKYDPINTTDYYSWYGIFESTRYSFPGSEQKKRPYDSIPAIPKAIASERNARIEAQVARLDADIKRLEADRKLAEERLKASGSWDGYVEQRRLKESHQDRDGHVGLQLWRLDPLPLVAINTSGSVLKIPGTVPPKKLVVHPNPKEGVGIAWRSPIAGRVRITGHVQDAHDCGDSILWYVDSLNGKGFTSIAGGGIDRNASQVFATDGKPFEADVQPGDFLQLAVMPKSNHGCDLTQVDFAIVEVDGKGQKWDVVSDVLKDMTEANPNDDQYGNAGVWYFYKVAEDRGQAFGATPRTPLSPTEIAELRSNLDRTSKELTRLMPERDQLKKSGPYEVVYGAIEQDKPKNAQIQIRGDNRKPGDAVPRKNLEILGHDSLPADAGSGRLQMAEWLTRRSNPLTARVMVNRIWQQHFGRGLVATGNDFGARGELPSHPQLLDWLASRFIESDWSINAIHRLIMNSATYQQSSAYDAVAAEADPDARLLWRFNRRRLSAEEIRDAMLFVSGDLDSTMGAEHPFPAVETWGFTQHAPYYGVYPTKRRSIYLMQQRLKRHPFLSLFDGADPNVSTARRELTTVPTQALYLMNNEFVHERSASLAARVMNSADDPAGRVTLAYVIALGRQPDSEETADSLAFLAEYGETLGEPGTEREQLVWSSFVRLILTRNEFLFVD